MTPLQVSVYPFKFYHIIFSGIVGILVTYYILCKRLYLQYNVKDSRTGDIYSLGGVAITVRSSQRGTQSVLSAFPIFHQVLCMNKGSMTARLTSDWYTIENQVSARNQDEREVDWELIEKEVKKLASLQCQSLESGNLMISRSIQFYWYYVQLRRRRLQGRPSQRSRITPPSEASCTRNGMYSSPTESVATAGDPEANTINNYKYLLSFANWKCRRRSCA